MYLEVNLNSKLKVFILALLTFSQVSTSWAAPLFFTCKKGTIANASLSDLKNYFQKILTSSKKERAEEIIKLCHGANECIANLKFATELAGVSYQIAFSLFEKNYSNMLLDKFDPAVKIAESEKETIMNGYKSLLAINACQSSLDELLPEKLENNGSLIIPYPYHNNYMYITGCLAVEVETCDPAKATDIEKVIRESLLMDVDPYVALSLFAMEGRAAAMGIGYLDPIALIGSMGCSAKQVTNDTPGAFSSYGTSYIVDGAIKKDAHFNQGLKKYFQEFNISSENKKSYFCNNIKSGHLELSEANLPNSCCLELDVSIDQNKMQYVTRALMYQFIKKTVSKPYKDNPEPAFTLQKYNGYTDLMGGAEQVAPWRSGVNFFETPMYGYQAMDFMLNAFLNNPWIKAQVEKYQKKYGSTTSLMCENRKDGEFVIDSDRYFEKLKKAPRLVAIAEKVKKGVPFSRLSKREQKVLMQEMEATADQNPYIVKKQTRPLDRNTLFQLLQQLQPIGPLIPYEICTESEYLSRLKGKTKLSKEVLLKLRQAFIEKDKESKKDQEKMLELSRRQREIFFLAEMQHAPDLSLFSIQLSKMTLTETSIDEIIQTKGNSLTEEGKQKLKTILNQIKSLTDSLMKIEDKKTTDPTDQLFGNEDRAFIGNAMIKAVPFEKIKEIYSGPIEGDPSTEERLKAVYDANKAQEDNRFLDPDIEKATKRYFEKIYPSRSSVAKTSDYSWERFSEDQVQRLIQNLRKR